MKGNKKKEKKKKVEVKKRGIKSGKRESIEK